MGWSWGSEPEWDTSMTYGPETYNNTVSAQWQYMPASNMIFTAKYLGFWTDDQPHIPEEGRLGQPGYINWWKWNSQYGINGDFPYVEAQKSNRQTVQADMSYYAEDFLGEHDIKFGAQYTKGRGNWMGGYFQNYANFPYPLGGGWGYVDGLGYKIDYLKTQTWYYGNAIQDGLLFYNNKVEMNPFLTVRTADSLGFFIDAKPMPPRVGITYQLTEDGKTVLRANYGRYYMPLAVEFLRRFGPDMQMTNLYYQIYMVPWDVADRNHDGYIYL